MKTQQNISISNKGLAMAPFYNHSAKLPSFSLMPLKYSKAELEGISDYIDFDLKVGKQATIEFFKRKAEDYSILHLSTHAAVDETDRDYSYLAFFPDQLLLVRDLYAMNLHSQMVVLSACESGLGYYQKGEGLFSLTSALTYAGVKSIFSTLWEVPDDSTKDLMLLFYEELSQGKSKDIALTSAKRQYIQSGKANPYLWASFIGIGDMSPLK
jgi:CHAT domain-containing protein